MRVALISLSDPGARMLARLTEVLPDTEIFVHESVRSVPNARGFESIISLTEEIFDRFDGLVYAAPCGVIVRALAESVKRKTSDPAVVVCDVGARYAVSLLSGHEGGANDLAVTVSNAIGAEPIITTTTEALKTVIVGIGCRRGTDSGRIVEAITAAMKELGVSLGEVRYLASVDIKADEGGLLAAAKALGIPLRFIPSGDIRGSTRVFDRSDFVEEHINLPAVAEPAALLAGRRTQLILPKKVYKGVTVAVAREGFS